MALQDLLYHTFNFTTLEGSFTAFEVMVTDLLNGPGRLVSYFTLILVEAPGAIGSFDHSGTVHPQEPYKMK